MRSEDLLHRFGRVSEGDSYNPARIMRFLADSEIGTDAYGATTLKFIEGGEGFFNGYEESALYADLTAAGSRHVDHTVLAVGAVIAAGGPIGESLAELGLDAGGPLELYERLNEESGADLSQYVDEVRQAISRGIDRAERD